MCIHASAPPRQRDFPLFPLPFSPKRSPPLCRARYRPIFSVFFLPAIRECRKCPFCPRFPPFLLIQINETPKIAHFPKKNPEKFCQFGKKQYLCTRFPENGTAETI